MKKDVQGLIEPMNKVVTLALCMAFLSGCATGLNSYQEHEMRYYHANGMSVEEKNPTTAAALGFLPGGGSFYTREPGLGVLNLLTWPLSIFWDPVSGYNGASSINYYATKANIKRLKNKDLRRLEEKLQTKTISMEQYMLEKRRIDDKYDFEV
ncbi:hypothetical protein GCM10023116_47260 [Kistimonas scapharcae]|uniref:Lipoprotein n=2 Tax=Kistimonas scapharcae TaxID=1036133 RepID=A0ABP8VBU3_9GAMM